MLNGAVVTNTGQSLTLVRLNRFQAVCENKIILHLKWLQWPLSVKRAGNEAEAADITEIKRNV